MKQQAGVLGMAGVGDNRDNTIMPHHTSRHIYMRKGFPGEYNQAAVRAIFSCFNSEFDG